MLSGLVAVVVIAAIPLYISSNKTSNICTKGKNIELIKEASLIIPNYYQGNKLNAIATKIKQLSGYNKDPNCLYVVFKNSEFIGNLNQAQAYLNKFKAYYNPKVGLSSYFGYYVTPQSMQNDLNFYLQNEHNKPPLQITLPRPPQ